MAKKITGSGILNAINSPKTDVNIPTFVEEANGTLVNPTERLADIGLQNAKTPQEVEQVLGAVETFDGTKKDLYSTFRKLSTIPEAQQTALSSLTSKLTPASERTPEFNPEQIDMGLYNAFSNFPPDKRRQMIADFNESVKANQRNVVEPAIEALGVQQYFPSLGQDNIRVGGYSGRVIGNVDIFVPRGGQLPFGLRDARKRAMQAQAQEKAAQAEKIKSLHYDTADQYQTQFDDLYMKSMDDYLKAANYDVSELSSGRTELSREYLKTNQKYENAAKEISYVDKINQQILSDLQAGKEVPQGTIDAMIEWRDGILNLEDFIKDGGKFPALAEKLRSYSNITELTDKMADQMKETGQTIRPLNMKSMTAEDIVKASDAFKLKKGSGYDSYISGIGKYFDTEAVNDLVNTTWEKTSNLYKGDGSPEEEQRQKAIFAENLISKLGSEVELKQTTVGNDDLENRKFKADQYWKNKKWEKETEQFYNSVWKKTTSEAAPSAEERIRVREQQLKSQGKTMTIKEKSAIINDEYNKLGLPPMVNEYGQPIYGFATFGVPKITTSTGGGALISGTSKTVRMQVNSWVNGKWVKTYKTADEIADNPQYYRTIEGKKLPSYVVEGAKKMKKEGVVTLKQENQYGYLAKKDLSKGILVPMEYGGEGETHNMIVTQGSFLTGTDDKGNTEFSQGKWEIVIDNSSEEGQSILGEAQKTKTDELKKVPNEE